VDGEGIPAVNSTSAPVFNVSLDDDLAVSENWSKLQCHVVIDNMDEVSNETLVTKLLLQIQ
jgi:hypothetical protein